VEKPTYANWAVDRCPDSRGQGHALDGFDRAERDRLDAAQLISVVSSRWDAPCGARRGTVPVVPLAEAADATYILHALLEGDEAAILGAAHIAAIDRAPGVILRLRLGHEPDCDEANTDREQKLFHARLQLPPRG
jgi:hypothetical protein